MSGLWGVCAPCCIAAQTMAQNVLWSAAYLNQPAVPSFQCHNDFMELPVMYNDTVNGLLGLGTSDAGEGLKTLEVLKCTYIRAVFQKFMFKVKVHKYQH